MRIRSFNDFSSLRAACPAVATTVQPCIPFLSLDWFEHLARNGMSPGPLHLLLADTTGSDGAALPVCLPLHWRPDGALASLSNYYSGIFGPVGEPMGGGPVGDGADAAIWSVLAQNLRASLPRPTCIDLQPLDTGSAFFSVMRHALTAAGYWVDSYFCFGNWFLPVAGQSFAAYFAARPSALRNTVRRGGNKLDSAGEWQVTVHTQPGVLLDTAITDYEAIYARSWKPAEAQPRFIRGMCQLAAQNGWLRLGVLSLNGQAIASQIWLFSGGTAYIFKLAYDPDAARYSAGSVLTAAMMEHAIDTDHADEVDYLSGDDAYKQDWMSQRRERHGIIAFDPATPRGLLAGLRHFGGRAVKWLLGKTT